MSAAAYTTRMVGDIGGTNTRLALFEPQSGKLTHVESYHNRDYRQLEDIIEQWLQQHSQAQPRECCLAVAAPPFEDRVSMLNMDWTFSRTEIAARFGFQTMRCINDFEGNAYALPHLQGGDLTTLRGEAGTGRGKCATLGPGTGLGGATLEFCVDTPVATASEPGHMGLSPATDLEIELFRALLPRYGQVWAELLLSGPGLERLHQTLAAVRGEKAEPLTAAEISARGLEEKSFLCKEVLQVFCALLGSVCGDYVLATGSYGGVYLAGGIVPRMESFLAASDFQARFDAKGEMNAHLAKMPLHVITCPTTGLLGAAHTPLAPAGNS